MKTGTRQHGNTTYWALALAGLFMLRGTVAEAREVTLAEDGAMQAVIVVAPETMSWEGDDRAIDRWGRISGATALEAEAEKMRRLQRDSIQDMAHYLERMTGAEIDIVTPDALPDNDRRIPIYIGPAAEAVFGPVGISMAGKFGFRVIVENRRLRRPRLGLYGESEYGASYAIYEWLHRIGCRWFMPGDLGEVVPDLPTLTVSVMDEKLAPATEWRRMEDRTADADFRRRNRMGGSADGGNVVMAQHTLEGYITAEQLEENPQWRLHDADGNPRPGRMFRWTREDVAEAIADTIIRRLDENYTPSISLSPGDYVRPTEDPEERKHDPEPRVWEPAAGRWSVTDRLMMLCNRVAERVGEKYPDVLFGVLAYVNYNLPPAREPVHPNVIPMIAPIDFNRHHPMTWPDHPNETWLLDMVQGWGEKADRIAYYAYGMNLAELSAPCPFITKWGTDIPIILENNLVYWAPETMAGWESMMPAYYLSIRMTFHPDETPEEILDDLWTRFYGPAAEPMADYWHTIDRAWIEAEEYSGCGFGYLQMFTPDVMQKARGLIDEALTRCEDDSLEYRRIKMIDESFALFELFMKMREDLAAGRLRHLGRDIARWRDIRSKLAERYAPQRVLSGLTESYVNSFFARTYEGAAQMEADYARHGEPMLEWKWKHNPGPEEASLPWTAPDYDDSDWPTTHVVRETWSTIGHHNTLTEPAADRSGRMAYRASQRLSALPEGKRALLWIGSTDGSAKVFVNGTHIPYIVPETTRWHEEGTELDRFSGYCTPASFDVTDALIDGENQFTILCERTNLNELGTGGLMGPVVIYRQK